MTAFDPQDHRSVSGNGRVPTQQAALAGNLEPVPAWMIEMRRRHPARRIAGRVTLEGKAFPGATVRLALRLGAETTAPADDLVESRVTGPDGTFDFKERLAGPYTIGASAPGKTEAVIAINLANPALQPAPDRIELRLGQCDASMYGFVRDASRAPISGAWIRPVETAALGAVTDAAGAYEICLAKGERSLAVGAVGYGTVVLDVSSHGRLKRDLILVPEASLVGICVAGADGLPIDGAMVTVRPSGWAAAAGRPATAMAISDADGRFQVVGLLPGRYLVEAVAAGRRSRRPGEVTTSVGTVSRTIIELEATARVSGTVSLSRQPVTGVIVRAQNISMGSGTSSDFTDDEGQFVLETVPPGEITFAVDGYSVISPTKVTVPESSHREVQIEVASLASIRGIVLCDGSPVSGVEISCTGGDRPRVPVRTFETGRFECRGLQEGTYEVSAIDREAGRFAEGLAVTVAQGESKDITIDLARGASIAGIVLNQDGKPVTGAFVQFAKVGDADRGESVTGEDGHFTVELLAGEGSYKATVASARKEEEAFPLVEASPVVLVPTATSRVDGVRLVVREEQLTIAGVVVDIEGQPLVDVHVTAERLTASQAARFSPWDPLPLAISDADGQFSLEGLGQGSYALLARAGDGAEGRVAPVGAGTRTVRISLSPGSSIEGTLHGFLQVPVVSAQLEGEEGRAIWAEVTGAAFHLRGIVPGAYVVSATNGREGESKRIMVPAGRAAQVTLSSHGTASLSGRITELGSGAPVGGQRCIVVTRTGDQWGTGDWSSGAHSALVDPSGHFEFESVPAGDVYVYCPRNQDDLSSAGRALTLAKDQRASVELVVVRRPQGTSRDPGAQLGWQLVVPRLVQVVPGGAAARAGLLPGDQLVTVNGVATDGLAIDGVAMLFAQDPGTRGSITYLRGETARQAQW